MRYDRKSGMWLRSVDAFILTEVPGVYGKVPVKPGDVLLDLGAHIGTTSRLLLSKGVARVIAVEADPSTVPILQRNLKGKPATVIWGAVGATAGRVAFYPRADRPWVGSILPDPDRRRVMVPMLPFAGLLAQYHPTIVKADIEFSEYELPEMHCLPDFVRVVAIELSIRYVGMFTGRTMDAAELRQRRETTADMIRSMERQGFAEVFRKTKHAKTGEPPAEPDASGFAPMVKALDVTWAR